MSQINDLCPRDGVRHTYQVRSQESLANRYLVIPNCAECGRTLVDDAVEGLKGYPCCSAWCAMQYDNYG